MRVLTSLGPTWRRPALLLAVLSLAACRGDTSRDPTREGGALNRVQPTPTERAIDSLLAAGDSVYRQQPESAAVLWEQAHLRATGLGDSVRIALALTGRSQAARELGRPAASREWGEAALRIKRARGMTSQLFRSLNALGLLAWREDRHADALSNFGEARIAAQASGDSSGVAKARMNEGLVLKEQGLFAEARQAFAEASQQFAVLGDTVNLARTVNNQAALEIALGQPQAAVTLLATARALARATRDSTLEVNARGQLAVAHAALGAPQRAFALIDSANALARAMGAVPEQAENLRVLGDLYLDAGDARHAIDSYQAAAMLHESLQQPAERATLLRQQANALRLEGNVDGAERLAREALAAHQRLGVTEQIFEDQMLLVDVAQRLGKSADVARLLDALEVTSRTLDVPVARGLSLLARGRELGRTRQWSALERLLTNSPTLDSLIGTDEQAERHLLRAQVAAARGDAATAVREARRAVTLVDQVRAQYASGALRARYTDTRARVYAELTLALLHEGNTTEAFAVADGARGRSLVELLGRTARGASAETDEATMLLRRIDALVRRLRVREAPTTPERRATMLASSAALRDSLRVLRSSYEALQARRGDESVATARVTTLDRFQRSLAANEVALEFLATPTTLLTFVVTRSGARTVSVPVRPETLAMRISLARALMEPQHDAMASRTLLVALHRDLVAPALATLPSPDDSRRQGAGPMRLVIIPHGLLAAVPFAALIDGRTGRYVVEDFSVLESPSAATLVALRSAPTAPPPSGVHAFAPLTTRLSASLPEVRAALREVRSAHSVAFTNGEASEAQMRRTVQQPVMVHFASHATVNGYNPLFSRLELQSGDGHDGRLEVHELMTLRVRSPLVFLSGCETALGNVRTTRFETRDEFTSLAQAWLIAGARSVVATLWRIDDTAAATLASHFYKALRTQAAPEALAAAQRTMLRENRTTHPYFWAAYQHVGTDR